MASITVSNVTLDFPVYGASQQSLRQTLFARTGGLIRRDQERPKRIVVRALDDVSFTLQDGVRLGLIGHNGAGKSTLLKALAGVYWPDSGHIKVEGRISPLFNSAPGLDLEDSGFTNIQTCGLLLGMTAEEVNRKLTDIAEFCELGEYLNLPVRTYSAGMLTRLCFAIATAIDPDVLLLDEGLAAGDARFAARAESRMHAMIERTRILVFASHSDALIKSLCNRAALMEKGKLIALGDVDEIVALYHSGTQNAHAAGGAVVS